MGKNKYIETPAKLLQYWNEYKNSLPIINVPVSHVKLGTVNLEVKQPIHERGFNVWLMDNYDLGNQTVHKYFKNEDGAYEEYRPTIARIKDDIFQHNYLYASVGLHKEKLTMSLLGMAEKSENKNNTELNLKTVSIEIVNTGKLIARSESEIDMN